MFFHGSMTNPQQRTIPVKLKLDRDHYGLFSRTLLVPLIGGIWSLIVGTAALIEGRRRV